jgi:hypothetical protein
MAQIIRFPAKFRDVPGAAGVDGMRYRCLMALRMLFDDVRAGNVDPKKMFVCYGSNWPSHPGTLSWSYLNLGFEPDELVKTIDLVLEDYKAHPNDSW